MRRASNRSCSSRQIGASAMLSSMRIEFLKMQGLGNDFFVFDAPAALAMPQHRIQVRALADRHTGVGFDQALMLEAPRDAAGRVFYRSLQFRRQRGRAMRQRRALCRRADVRKSPATRPRDRHGEHGRHRAAPMREDGLVSVDMGTPDFDPRSLPMDAAAEAALYSLKIGDEAIEFGAVSIGNPHVGAARRRRESRAGRANWAYYRAPPALSCDAPTWDSCKSWIAATSCCACSSAVPARLWPAAPAPAPRRRSAGSKGLLDADVRVDLPGGTAHVSWPGPGQHVWLTGPATTVFTGTIDI